MVLPNFRKPRVLQYDYDKKNEIIHKNPKTLYKFGYTHLVDASDRFSLEHHSNGNFRNIPFKTDYDQKILWSAWFPDLEIAKQVEKLLLKEFPFKNYYTDTNYNGVTEARVFEEDEAQLIIKELYESVNNSIYSFSEGYVKVYFAKLTKRQPKDIFDDKPIITQTSLF